MVAVNITVNGRETRGEAPARMLLVTYLREHLALTGTHMGCDTSQCGACTVHFNGRAIKSCTMLAAQADGGKVTTIEGLDPAGRHPLQLAFQDKHGLQCGYCTPGMIMAAADILRANPNADEAAIREGLEGNLCRCTGYQQIVDAVLSAAATMRQGANNVRV